MPAWVLPAAALALQAAPEINKFIVGQKQKKQAEKLGRDYPRPERKTSEFYRDYLTNSAMEAYTSGLPGEGGILNNLRSLQGTSMRAIGESQQSPAAMMAGFLGTQQQMGEQVGNLGVQAAQYRASQLPAYYSALDKMGQEDNANWEWNKQDPYEDAMGAKSALEFGAITNKANALVGLGNVGVNAVTLNAMGAFGNKTGGGGGGFDPKLTGGIKGAMDSPVSSPIDPGIVNSYDLESIREDAEAALGKMSDDIFMKVYMPMYMKRGGQQNNNLV